MSTKPKPSNHAPQGSHTERIWYVQESGRIGFGRTYGEHSFNYRPVQSEPGNGKGGTRLPFSPITPPRPPADKS